jgi:hypothetical protein
MSLSIFHGCSGITGYQIVGPNLMLPTMLTLWGIVTTLQGQPPRELHVAFAIQL